ncbi:MAG: quinolinate synthase NadA, partial [bacterium]
MELSFYTRLTEAELHERIVNLKKQKGAVILVHNYQRNEVQLVGDFIGDSLGLAKRAMETDARIILFAGVRFMAETAKILNPKRKVLLPDLYAGCPLAACATVDELREFKKNYPNHAFVAYINSTADVKAEVDVVCTSGNAVKVVERIPSERIVFLPDRNLGHFVSRFVKNKEIVLWDGGCYVHTKLTVEHIKEARLKYPGAKIIVHPESPPEVVDLADGAYSTEGIINYVKKINTPVVIGTEIGIIDRIKREMPEKIVYPLKNDAICGNMKLITLPKVLWSLEND